MVPYLPVKMINQIIQHSTKTKKTTQSCWTGSNQFVQIDKMVFLTLVQMGSYFTNFSNKKNHEL
jgi:hypothetical protein